MYYALYDRQLKTIGETYILESWERTQRAMDFDEMKIVGEQIPYSADPYFVVVNDKRGKQLFSGLASTPVIDDKKKKTTISLKDYMTLLNSDIVVNWSNFTGTTLSSYIDFVLGIWKTQNGSLGFDNVVWDVSRVKGSLDTGIPLGSDTESVLAYTLISDCMNYYGIWCESTLDVFEKKLTFTFRNTETGVQEVRLKDFGINQVEKSFGEFNKVTIYNHNYVKQQSWVLTTENTVVKEPLNSSETPVYPTKNRNYIAEEPDEDLSATDAVNNAVYDAVMSLADNRYQENIDLDVAAHSVGVLLKDANFSLSVRVYTEEGYYKTLPVGEIVTDSKGKHIVKIGYRVQELTQEL